MREFYVKDAGRMAVDQLCQCGHQGSQHADVVKTYKDFREMEEVAYLRVGNCEVVGCECARFTWAAWVFSDN